MDAFRPLNYLLFPMGLNLFPDERSKFARLLLSLLFIASHVTCFIIYSYTVPPTLLFELFTFFIMNPVCEIVFILVHHRARQSMEDFLTDSEHMLAEEQKQSLTRKSRLMAFSAVFHFCVVFAEYLYQAYVAYPGAKTLALAFLIDGIGYLNNWAYLGLCEFVFLVYVLIETEKAFFDEAYNKLRNNRLNLYKCCMQRFQMRERQHKVNSVFGIVSFLWFVHVFFDVACYFMYAAKSKETLIEIAATLPFPLMMWCFMGYMIFVTQSYINMVKEKSTKLYQEIFWKYKGQVNLSDLRRELGEPYSFDAWGVFKLNVSLVLSLVAGVISFLTLAVGIQSTFKQRISSVTQL